jgi:hypothetical protein
MASNFDLPATYQIRVKGCLDDRWSERLGGMEIRSVDQVEGAPETSLVGWLPDQAALSGVLNTLYGLHLPLLSVEMIQVEKEQRGHDE